ncbi:TPA: glycerate kinase, partial [Enterococcus faecium]|nr:glycerate kinase [Enterococcus faecium]
GKAPIGIAKRAKKYDLPVVAIVGNRDADLSEIYQNGIDLVLSNIPRPMSLEEAIKEVKENTILAGETAMRAFLLNNKTTKEG